MTKDDPINYFGKIPHKFYLKTKFNLADRVFYSLTTSCYVINDAVVEKPCSRGTSFVFCVRVKSDVNDERKILGTRLAHENEVGQKYQ